MHESKRVSLANILHGMTPVVREAGRIALSHFRRAIAEHKQDRSLVSVADRDVERFLVREIKERYPEHAVLGEEYGAEGNSSADYQWAIDPIDGTSSYLAEMPIWAVSVGLLHEGRPVLGMVLAPVVDEFYVGSEETGATLNERPLFLSPPTPVDDNTPLLVFSNAWKSIRLRFPGKVWSQGSTAVHIATVAKGTVVGAVCDPPFVWDVAGAAVIVRQAGCDIRYSSGRPMEIRDFGGGRSPEPIICAHPSIIDDLLSRVEWIL